MPTPARTQIYLSNEQRTRLDAVAANRQVSMATVVREAIDRYLGELSEQDVDRVLDQTYGMVRAMADPRRTDWGRRGRRPR